MVKKVEQKKTTKKAVKNTAKKTVKTQKVKVADVKKECETTKAFLEKTFTVYGYTFKYSTAVAAGAVVLAVALLLLF